MTIRQPISRPVEGALVRVAVRGEAWAERIPPVPGGAEVTVSFSDADAALVHGDALTLLGYRLVGTPPDGAGEDGPAADFLVPQPLLEAHPRWWRALATQGERVYSLACGPVLVTLSRVLSSHRAVGGSGE